MFEIKKNIINKDRFNKINNLVLDDYFPWYFQKEINKVDKTGHGYFTHTLVLDKKINSNYYYDIMPEIINSLNLKSLIRARLNLYPRTLETIKHAYHVDFNFKHKSIVYFLNNNNGKLFFKEPYKEVKAEENKCVIFNGNYLHSSSSCTDKVCRITLNINYDSL